MRSAVWRTSALPARSGADLTLCKERRQYGELVRPGPSRFLLELPQDDLIWETERKVVSPQERMQKGQSHLANIREQLAKAKASSDGQGGEPALFRFTD